MSILKLTLVPLALLAAIAVFGGSHLLAAPPVPFLSDTEPGIDAPHSGDPADDDTWNFESIKWGKSGHANPSNHRWEIIQSPFPGVTDASDVVAACQGNVFNLGSNYEGSTCANATRRYHSTFMNPIDRDVPIPMNTTRDWVFSFDFKIDILPADTFGTDKLFDLSSFTRSPISGDTDLMSVRGAGPVPEREEWGGSYLNGQYNRYNIWHGPIPEGGSRSDAVKTPIEFEVTEGRFTVHYKASNQRLDLWLDDTRLLENFESATGNYDVRGTQLGGGLMSFENVAYDNVRLGVLATSSPLAGDVNGDGVVDVADLGVVGANFGQINVTFADGDFNGDNMVDVADLGILGANWTASQVIGLASALVPEPTTLSLLAMSVLLVGRRRR